MRKFRPVVIFLVINQLNTANRLCYLACNKKEHGRLQAMKAGSLGTFVISWAQVEVDGLPAPSLDTLIVGAVWRWHGESIRVDGSSRVLLLSDAINSEELHQRAARTVRRLIGQAQVDAPQGAVTDRLIDGGFDLTDGVRKYEMTVIDCPNGGAPLIMAIGEMPPRRNQSLGCFDTSVFGSHRPRGKDRRRDLFRAGHPYPHAERDRSGRDPVRRRLGPDQRQRCAADQMGRLAPCFGRTSLCHAPLAARAVAGRGLGRGRA